MTQTDHPTVAASSSKASLAKFLLPGTISVAAILYLANTIDFRGVGAEMDLRAAAILIPALIVYGILTLVIEALSMKRPMRETRADFTHMTAARVKAASYLMGLIHYALGAGTLTLLIRRRAGVSIAEAAGVVILIMMFDLGMIICLVAIGMTMISNSAVEMQIGVMLGLVALIVGGFALLRAPFSLGPLDRIRDLNLFIAARTIAPRELVELAVLRLCFMLCLEGVGWAALTAFDIIVPFSVVLVNFSMVALAALLPSVAGIGPSQVALVEFFQNHGSRESLLACSVALSAGLILLRAVIGIAFAGEFSREAYAAVRSGEVDGQAEAVEDSGPRDGGAGGGT